MGNINKQKVVGMFMIIAVFAVFVFYAVSYLNLDTLGVYDAPGHVLAVHQAQSFWPNWHGWTSSLLGFSQGATYPAGVHWVMTGLSFIFAVPVAVKLVVCLSILLLPISIWTYLRSIKYSGAGGFLMLNFLLVVFMVSPGYLGSSLKALFNSGMITNFVALPLLFFFIASIERLVKEGNRTVIHVATSAVLLAALVWSHLVIALIGLLYFGLVVVQHLVKFNRRKLRNILIVAVGGFILCLPIIIKVVLLLKNRSSPGVGIPSLLLPNLLTLILATLFTRHFWSKRNYLNTRLSILSAFLALLCLADSVLISVYGTSFFLDNLHIYRFQIFAYVLFTIASSSIIVTNVNKLSLKKATYISIAAVGVLATILVINNPTSFSYARIRLFNPTSIQGRFIEAFSRVKSYPAPYSLQSNLTISNKRSEWAYGLFIESSQNAPFIKSLSISLDNNSKSNTAPKGLKVPIDGVVLSADKVKDALDLFAINNVIYLDSKPLSSIAEWHRNDKNMYYHSIQTEAHKTAEVPTAELVPVKANWSKEVEAWWKSPGPIRTILYDASDRSIPNTNNPRNIRVDFSEASNGKMSVNIHSKSKVPVLVKYSYSPEWKAYDSDGDELTIWRASPYLMLIYASGQVDFVYK